MKTFQSYKLLAATLAAVLAFTLLSACGNNGNGEGAKQGGDSPEKSGGVKELSLFIDAPWYPVKEWKGPIAEKITEKTGVKLNVTVATDDKLGCR